VPQHLGARPTGLGGVSDVDHHLRG
jgi:hypothetical protein